jgi:hypothetical protein
MAHSRDGGRPSWRPLIGVVLPPPWHPGHKGQAMPRISLAQFDRIGAGPPRGPRGRLSRSGLPSAGARPRARPIILAIPEASDRGREPQDSFALSWAARRGGSASAAPSGSARGLEGLRRRAHHRRRRAITIDATMVPMALPEASRWRPEGNPKPSRPRPEPSVRRPIESPLRGPPKAQTNPGALHRSPGGFW